ncbi:MAG TPA: transglycosylase SLT domain-containing protein [Myxococcales bacterium]|nr:transglycosylase SLT domain-containing protein [Myxococcales bacterium]
MKSNCCAILGAIVALFVHRTSYAADGTAERAGALLAAGSAGEAAAVAGGCPEARCRLVLGRSLFALERLPDAAVAFHEARVLGPPLADFAELLEGESLLLSGRPQDALEPLRLAAAALGPPGLRAAALLADALLAGGDSAGALQQAQTAAAMPGQPPEAETAMAWDAAQALLALARADPGKAPDAARALRQFWLMHPEHPAAEAARAAERELAQLPEPAGRELLMRGSRLLSAGQPAAAAVQAAAAGAMLAGADKAEAALLQARSLAADGKRGDATADLEQAWAHGAPHVAAQAGMLLARDRARHGRDAEAIKLADAIAKKYVQAPEAEEGVLFAARLLADSGQRAQASKRLAKLAARRAGPNASAARWMLAWMSYRDGLRDAPERFAEFAATAQGDEERAQGLYWEARAGKPAKAAALLQKAADLDALGWYGLVARQQLGQAQGEPPPFPPARPPPAEVSQPRLQLGLELASLGLLTEAAAEADWFVRHHPGDAGALALPVYREARRPDRALLLAEALTGGRGAHAPRPLLEAAYPAAYPEQVAHSASRAGLDPYFLLAVMRRESLFKADTRSAAGAVGLLQLLPATARRAAAVLGRPPMRDEELVEPATAIDLGAWYLAELLGRFGDPAVALAAYNAGPRVAAPWATQGAGRPIDVWVEDIPYRETRRYVKVVMGAWSAYRILAGGAPPTLSAATPAPRAGVSF